MSARGLVWRRADVIGRGAKVFDGSGPDITSPMRSAAAQVPVCKVNVADCHLGAGAVEDARDRPF
ncbi:MAG: hypothetical protein OXC72_08015 [Roseovarius sp.]|nr:hypothetical protein [Roseovarius sp.]